MYENAKGLNEPKIVFWLGLNLNLNVTALITKNCLSGTGKVSSLFMSNSDWIGRDL